MAMNSADRAVPISDVTDRVGDALSDLCRSCERLQGLIAPLILEAAGRHPSHLKELQEFDHICQKLGNLADFVAALALVLPDDWRLDPSVASRVVTMSDLSSHLGFAGEAEAARDHAPGDFELF
ncbi:MAG TPA: hypothetical protein VKA03_03270 [Methylovirgula sp.]|nr:hypothetical protein [Methylovirgula sp.]